MEFGVFNDTKYTTWYWSIIEHAKTRPLTGYKEQHHILPRSLGGSDDLDNLVYLTSREHFIVHWLLTKMTTGKDKSKMLYAWWAFHGHKAQRNYSSRYYEMLRKSRIGFEFSEETKHKMSIAAIERCARNDQTGSNNQAFKGWYMTPWGKFASQAEITANTPICGRQVHNYCKKTDFVFRKPRAFPEWKNKTAKEVGFYFVEAI